MNNYGCSLASISLIVNEEVSSQEYYQKHYTHPEWPGGMSGVTIGIGYDCGYTTHAKLDADFKGKISDFDLALLHTVVGVNAQHAHALLPTVRSVTVPWVVAMDVFQNNDLPTWVSTVRRALPNTEDLAPDCLGALVSLAYNRGASFSNKGERYAEMRDIKAHMANKQFDKIPECFRSMKRLWNNGLVGRREREALLFERGLRVAKAVSEAPIGKPVVVPPVVTQTSQARDKAIQTGTGGAIASGASAFSSSLTLTAIVIAASLVTAYAVYYFASRHKRTPVAD